MRFSALVLVAQAAASSTAASVRSDIHVTHRLWPRDAALDRERDDRGMPRAPPLQRALSVRGGGVGRTLQSRATRRIKRALGDRPWDYDLIQLLRVAAGVLLLFQPPRGDDAPLRGTRTLQLFAALHAHARGVVGYASGGDIDLEAHARTRGARVRRAARHATLLGLSAGLARADAADERMLAGLTLGLLAEHSVVGVYEQVRPPPAPSPLTIW